MPNSHAVVIKIPFRLERGKPCRVVTFTGKGASCFNMVREWAPILLRQSFVESFEPNSFHGLLTEPASFWSYTHCTSIWKRLIHSCYERGGTFQAELLPTGWEKPILIGIRIGADNLFRDIPRRWHCLSGVFCFLLLQYQGLRKA